MTRHELLRLLEETLEMKPQTLKGGETLRDLEGWDSLSTITFIALVDKRFGRPLPGSQVARCRTVSELLTLVGVEASGCAA